MMYFDKTKAVINNYKEDGLLCNAAVRIGRGDTVLCDIYTESINEQTLFDMASVTKILSVTSLTLMALDRGDIALYDKVSKYFDVPAHNRGLTVFNLLTHTTGVGHRKLDLPENNYDNIADYILSLEGAPIGTAVDYSCPAFILMGKILEKVYGKRLDELFCERVAKPLNMNRTSFLPTERENIVSSGVPCTVNDYNCRHLGGVAGNAGIFSCIDDMTEFANMLLSDGRPLYSKQILDKAVRNQTEGLNEARGLGFLYVDERYKQTGRLFPVGSFGHCGHTGTSVFVNRDSGLYVIILTDATLCVKKQGKDYETVKKMREDIHNAISEDMNGERYPDLDRSKEYELARNGDQNDAQTAL